MPTNSSKRAPPSRAITKPYIRKTKVAKVPYKSSAQPKPVHKCSHLTLGDWLHVVEWYDQIQPVSLDATVKHFRNHSESALIFDQASLSRHLTVKGPLLDWCWNGLVVLSHGSIVRVCSVLYCCYFDMDNIRSYNVGKFILLRHNLVMHKIP
jgi:hypothetical protein